MDDTSAASRRSHSMSPRRASRLAIAWCCAFVLSLALYAATANRGPQWQDSGQRILRVVTGEVVESLGLALSHPLHHWLGRLAAWPGGLEPAYAVTLVSSFSAAVAVANLLGCVWTLTRSWPAAIFAATSLGVAHTFWQMATVTETYTLGTALLTGECWCLVAFLRYRKPGCCLGMFLLNGLGVANHLLALLTLPVLSVIALREWRAQTLQTRHLLISVLLWICGSLPYSGLVLVECLRTGDVAATLQSALFGRAYAANVLNTTISLRPLAISLGFIVYNFPNLLLPAAVIGVFRAGSLDVPRTVLWALLAGLLIHAGFVLRYNIQDRHTFFLPMYVFLTIFGGMGAARVLRSWSPVWRRRVLSAAVVLLAATPVEYVVGVHLARRAGLLAGLERHRPYRDDYVYILVPWSVVERSADRMSREAADLAGPDGVILYEDDMGAFAIRYRAITSGRPGLKVLRASAVADAGGWDRFLEVARKPGGGWRRVVLVPDNVNRIRSDAPPGMAWARVGDLYVLETGPASAPTPG